MDRTARRTAYCAIQASFAEAPDARLADLLGRLDLSSIADFAGATEMALHCRSFAALCLIKNGLEDDLRDLLSCHFIAHAEKIDALNAQS